MSNFWWTGSADFDSSRVPLETLAKIRGAMWTARLDLPYGPRPGSPDNILATDFLADYSPTDQLRAIKALKDRGYTHVVVGPIVDSDGYHGKYPAHDWRQNFDQFLDILQLFWNHGLIPIVFVHPDGWTLEQTQTLTPLLTTPRAQRLIRVVVPSGWEPTKYDWSSYTWALYCQWARTILPNALVLIHTVSDVDAPVGVDARGNDNLNPNGNADGWARVCPYLHGWLIQNGPYETDPSADPQLAQNFGDQFRASVPHSLAWHFAGNAGWPTTSAWGNQRIRLYAAEQTSYEAFWFNLPESASIDWGTLAMEAGADGFLDSGPP